MNMMKKICLLVLIMVLGKMSFSQGYPVTQYIGTDSAVVISRGAMQSRLVNYVYTDTTQANTQRIKSYPGAQIVTTNGGTNFILWIRNQTATRWLQIPAGSGVGNIYTVDGTLTGNRTLLGANNSLTFNQISSLLFGADTTTVTNDGVATLNVKGAIGRVLVVDTTAPADERIYELKSSNGEFFISKINDAQTLQDSTFYISSGGNIGINTFSPGARLGVNGNTFVKGQLFAGDTALSTYQVEGILTTPYVLGRKAVDTTLSTQARPTGVQGHVVGRGPIANRLQGGTFYATTDSASTANSTGSLRATTSWTAHNGSGTLANAWGSYNIVSNKTTGTITNAYGSVSGVENRGATSTINKLQGSTTEVWNNYGGTIDTAWGQVISIYNNNASSNIGAVYGLSIGRGLVTPTGGTHFWRNAGTIGSSYGIYLDSAIDVGTNRFALYSNSYSDSYLKGNLGLGTATPDSNLTVVNGALFQRGVRMSGLPTGTGTKGLRVDANGTLSVADTLSNGVSGSLISGYLTKATGTNSIDTSQIFQTNGKIGIGRTNPTAKVDISDSLGTALRVTNIGPYGVGGDGINVRVNGWSGYAALIEQRDSSAAGTQYQTVFRKGMLPGYGNPAPGGGVAFITQIGGENEVYKNLTVYRARMIDSTGYSVGQVMGTSQEIWTRKNGVWDTTLVLNQGNVGVNTGQNGIDSALTVANGTWLKRGVRMSALPTGVGTKAVRIDANGTLSVADTLTNGVSGSLISGYITKATGTNSIDTSQIYQNNGNIGIGTISPASGFKVDMVGSLRVGNGSSYNNVTINGNGSAGSYLRFQKNGTNKGDIGPYSAVLGGVPPYSGSNDDLTYSSVGGHFFNTNAGIKMYLNNAGNLGLSASPDSMLTVLEGAYLQRGVRMSGLPTGVGTKAVRINANGTLSVADTLANGISGTGTTNYIPKFTSSSAIGNSAMYESGGTFFTSTNALNVRTNTSRANITTDADLVTQNGLGILATSTTYGQGYQYIRLMNSASAYTGSISQTESTGIGLYSASALIFGSSSTERMRLDASGNLGLGTSSPAYKLDVTGTGNFTSNLTVGGYVNSTNQVIANNTITDPTTGNTLTNGTVYALNGISTANNFGIGVSGVRNSKYDIWFQTGTTNGGGYRFYQGTTERMTLDASGNLGLGVTPSTWSIGKAMEFRTAGNSIWSYQNDNIYLNQNATFNGAWYYGASATAAQYILFQGNHIWQTAPSGTAGAAITFTERMRLDINGNLGLGVTPSAWGATIKGFQTQYNGYFATSADGTAGLTIMGNNGYFNGTSWIYQINGYAGNYNYSSISGSHYWRTAPSGTAGNAISFTQAMTLDASGRLGIGTTSPTYPLFVYKAGTNTFSTVYTIAGFNDGAGTYKGINLGYDSGSQTGVIFAETASSASNMAFWTYSGSAWGERMRITSGGNVGIGTTSPGSRLTVSNSTAGNLTSYIINGVTAASGSTGYGLAIESEASAATSYALTVRNLAGSNTYFHVSTATGMVGNVGIGTTSPSYKLEVAGGSVGITNTAGNNAYLEIAGNGNTLATTSMLYGQSNQNTGYVWNRANANILFGTNNTENMRLTSAGELLINTTSDAGDYKLQVSGNGYFTGDVVAIGNLVPSGNIRSAGGMAFTSAARYTFESANSFQPTSGTATYAAFSMINTINQTGGANGITRGLYVNPTLTAAADFRAIEWSNNSGWGLYGVGTANNYLAGSLGIGTTSPNASALLDVSSTTKGFLPPRMTGAQAEAIATPAAGLMIYANSGNGTTITSTGWWGYDGAAWVKLN